MIPTFALYINLITEMEIDFTIFHKSADGNAMLRQDTGDWIGTFLGHKVHISLSLFSLYR